MPGRRRIDRLYYETADAGSSGAPIWISTVTGHANIKALVVK